MLAAALSVAGLVVLPSSAASAAPATTVARLLPTATVDLGAAPLVTGWYSFSAKASDGTSTSSASPARVFHVAVAPVPVSRAGVTPSATFEGFDPRLVAGPRCRSRRGRLLVDAGRVERHPDPRPGGLLHPHISRRQADTAFDRSGSLTEIRDRSENLIDPQYGGSGQI